MFIITIKVEHEATKDGILEELGRAEENGYITEPFQVQVDETFIYPIGKESSDE